MSMTREEAITCLQEKYDYCKSFYDLAAHPEEDYPEMKKYLQALQIALSALRGPTREQVEKMRGEWQVCFEEWQNHRVEGEQCSKCGFQNYGPSNLYNFCPKCGSPITGKAVDMVMERLEALGYSKDD